MPFQSESSSLPSQHSSEMNLYTCSVGYMLIIYRDCTTFTMSNNHGTAMID
jgi:hypothetical protein